MALNRPILAVWAQLGFRIIPALLLLTNLGFMLYCSATFRESLIIGYVLVRSCAFAFLTWWLMD